MATAVVGRRMALVIIAVAMFFLTCSLVAPSPLYPLYQERWGFSSLAVTIVFAAYVMAMLATLLVAGALSDSLGRRPVIIMGLVAGAVAMVLFFFADGFVMLFIARLFQGITFGLATGALTAAMVELTRVPGVGALVAIVVQSLGLALGSLGTGMLVEFGPYPFQLIYFLLFLGFVATAVLVVWTRESNDKRHLSTHSWRPRVSIPRPLRRRFLQLVPCMIAAFALNGFYLSLGPSLADLMLNADSPFAGGLLMFSLTGPAVVSGVLSRRAPVRWSLVAGSALMASGLLVTLLGIQTGQVLWLYLGTAVAGLGWGPAAQSLFTALATVTPQHQRAGMMSAIFVVSYLAFSVPAVTAAALIPLSDFTTTVTVYLLVVLFIAVVSLVWSTRLSDPDEVAAAAPAPLKGTTP